MRTREMGYRDYSISQEELQRIEKFCQDERNSDVVAKAAILSNASICELLFLSMRRGVSYDTIETVLDPYVSKVDFYAYRRRAYSNVKKLMR